MHYGISGQNAKDEEGIKPKQLCEEANVHVNYGKALLRELDDQGKIEAVKISQFDRRVYSWKPLEQAKPILSWQQYLPLVEQMTLEYLRSHDLLANLQEIYSFEE